MKLLQDNAALHADEFSNASPYIIMFGPDKCGATNKVKTPTHQTWPSLTAAGSLHLPPQEPEDG
jgi:hypothetical protein